MKKFVLLASALLLMSVMAAAQTEDRVCEVSRVTSKPGAEKQLEAGRKTHNAFHTAQKDPYSIIVWSVLSGNSTGSYLMTTCNMKWSSLDRAGDFDAKDTADIARTFGQYAAGSTTSYYVERTDMQAKPADPNAKMPKLISITTFYLKGDGAMPFVAAVKKIGEAINKSNYPSKSSRWYQLATGGEGPQFVLVGDRASWADMQGPEKTLQTMLEEVYGKDDNTLQTLRGQIRYTHSELAEYRPDLSYMAAK
jgi:hypothetical protein